MRDDVDADRVEAIGDDRDFQFRAETVHARYQHRLFDPRDIQAVHGAEAADIAQDVGVVGFSDDFFDPTHDFVLGVDIDANVAIAHVGFAWFGHGSTLEVECLSIRRGPR